MPNTLKLPQQFSDLAKSHVETQLALINMLSSKAFEGMEKTIALNFSVTKTMLEHSGATARQLLQARDANEFFALSAGQFQPNIASLLEYGQQLRHIASGMQADLIKATIDKASAVQQQVTGLMDDAKKEATPGAALAAAVPAREAAIAPEAVEAVEADTKKTAQAASARKASEAAAAKRIAEAAVTKKVAEAAAAENIARLAAKQNAKEAAAAKRATQLIAASTEKPAVDSGAPAIALTTPETAASQADPASNTTASKAKPAIKAKAANPGQPKPA